MAGNKIPDTQFGFYPGRSTLQPIFIMRHLQHAARTLQPRQSGRLHTAFIDFKQAYDTIPRQALWQHLQRIGMPTSLLSIIQDMYADDEYVLKDGDKTARVHPSRGVKQGCPLSPLLFSLYVNDVDEIAEGVQGAVTGMPGFCVTHMLYADDLTLTANDHNALQKMLDRLHVYAQRKHLIINTAKSEVVHFNSSGPDVPVLRVGEVPLVHKESFKYLGMMFHKRMSMAKSSEHAVGPFMASAYRIRQFVQEKSLTGRPHVSLWLGKTYVIPAGMYGGQVWGTEYLRHGKEFASDLQVRHMSFLKSTLGVKRTTTNWAVLRECGHEPLQYYWFRSAVKLYNSMLKSNSVTVQKVLRADMSIHSREPSCWTAKVLDAFQGLRRCDVFVQAVRQSVPISLQDFTDDLRHRLRGVWRDVEGADLRGSSNKLATYHALFAVPFDTTARASACLPRHLFLDLSPRMLRNISCFRLRAHKLRVETANWNTGTSPLCDRCDCAQVQDEVHALLMCRDVGLCALRRKYAHLFSQFVGEFSVERPYLTQPVCDQAVSDFLLQYDNSLFFFVSELMDLLLTGEDQSQADQPNNLAEGHPM